MYNGSTIWLTLPAVWIYLGWVYAQKRATKTTRLVWVFAVFAVAVVPTYFGSEQYSGLEPILYWWMASPLLTPVSFALTKIWLHFVPAKQKNIEEAEVQPCDVCHTSHAPECTKAG
jgi:hypothetical protein